MGREGPKWGGDAFFWHNKNLADILGRTDFDLRIFDFRIFFIIGLMN